MIPGLGTRPPVRIFATCPQSRDVPSPGTYLDRVSEIARCLYWS